jgi:mitotic spindle assembly checkpoint protein MAD2
MFSIPRWVTYHEEWEVSDPRYIADNAEQVKLRSFNTSVHKVEGLVSYKASDE